MCKHSLCPVNPANRIRIFSVAFQIRNTLLNYHDTPIPNCVLPLILQFIRSIAIQAVVGFGRCTLTHLKFENTN